MDLPRLMSEQAGVVARRQVLAAQLDDSFIERKIRRNDWATVHRGVYVGHTGPLGWDQRLWAALLFYDRAAACDESALVLHGLRSSRPGDVIHVAVDRDRRVARLPGVQLHRIVDREQATFPNRTPRRLRLERAVLQHAGRARDEVTAVAALADACGSRRTTPGRLADELQRLPRLRRRAFLLAVLDDVASGTHSVLEHRYLVGVERPHRLPRGFRQLRAPGRAVAYRDVEYLDGRLVVELDGRLGHDGTEERWADLDRDIDSVLAGATTVRLGWQQVLSPCRVAAAVTRLLHGLGWRGSPVPCGPGCVVRAGDSGVFPAPAADKTPLSSYARTG